jgi:CPA1 family monovalent cation:H+ antiporter
MPVDAIIAGTLALLVIAILVAVAARRLALPYTVGLVVAGMGLALARYDTGIRLTHDIIFDVILPPLLFEAAINISWPELRRDLLPVLVLSVLGVVISGGVVAGGMAWLLGWGLAPALMFGVLIAATDPVAVIAMFKDTGIGGRLRLLVESESLFNDGVAAVLFGLALAWVEGMAFGPVAATASLVTVAGGGIAIGLLAGAAALFVAGRTSEHMIEAAVTGVAAYGAFLGAEYLDVSGVLATVSAGLLMGSMGVRGGARFGLSRAGRLFVVELWDFAAFLANSLVFLLIGLTVAKVPFDRLGFLPLAVAILLVLAGRAATIYPICLVFARSRWAVPAREQHVLWWGGLRGALALALVLTLPPEMPGRDAVVIATFGVVAFSVLVQGLSMKWLLRQLSLLPSA